MGANSQGLIDAQVGFVAQPVTPNRSSAVFLVVADRFPEKARRQTVVFADPTRAD
jgi:hypothetical protein